MEELLTWQALATMAGASIATGGIVQLIKARVPLKTDILSYIVAVIVMEAATFFLGATELGAYVLVLINAIFVAAAANRGAQVLGQDGRPK